MASSNPGGGRGGDRKQSFPSKLLGRLTKAVGPSRRRRLLRQTVSSVGGDDVILWLNLGGNVNSQLRNTDGQLRQGAFTALNAVPGDTLLHLAMARGDSKLILELLRRGADITRTNINGENPFHRLTLARNASNILADLRDSIPAQTLQNVINHPNNDGQTPFMLAIQRLNLPYAIALLRIPQTIIEEKNRDEMLHRLGSLILNDVGDFTPQIIRLLDVMCTKYQLSFVEIFERLLASFKYDERDRIYTQVSYHGRIVKNAFENAIDDRLRKKVETIKGGGAQQSKGGAQQSKGTGRIRPPSFLFVRISQDPLHVHDMRRRLFARGVEPGPPRAPIPLQNITTKALQYLRDLGFDIESNIDDLYTSSIEKQRVMGHTDAEILRRILRQASVRKIIPRILREYDDRDRYDYYPYGPYGIHVYETFTNLFQNEMHPQDLIDLIHMDDLELVRSILERRHRFPYLSNVFLHINRPRGELNIIENAIVDSLLFDTYQFTPSMFRIVRQYIPLDFDINIMVEPVVRTFITNFNSSSPIPRLQELWAPDDQNILRQFRDIVGQRLGEYVFLIRGMERQRQSEAVRRLMMVYSENPTEFIQRLLDNFFRRFEHLLHERRQTFRRIQGNYPENDQVHRQRRRARDNTILERIDMDIQELNTVIGPDLIGNLLFLRHIGVIGFFNEERYNFLLNDPASPLHQNIRDGILAHHGILAISRASEHNERQGGAQAMPDTPFGAVLKRMGKNPHQDTMKQVSHYLGLSSRNIHRTGQPASVKKAQQGGQPASAKKAQQGGQPPSAKKPQGGGQRG